MLPRAETQTQESYLEIGKYLKIQHFKTEYLHVARDISYYKDQQKSLLKWVRLPMLFVLKIQKGTDEFYNILLQQTAHI